MHPSEAPPCFQNRDRRIPLFRPRTRDIPRSICAASPGNCPSRCVRSSASTRGTATSTDTRSRRSFHQPRRLKLIAEVNLRAQQRRAPQPHKLPKHVAQRKQMQKAYRLKRARILQILPHLVLDRLQRDENIAMRMHNAARLRRSPRSKHNLKRRLRPNRLARREQRLSGEMFGETAKCELRSCRLQVASRGWGAPHLAFEMWVEQPQQTRVPHDQPRPHIPNHPPSKLRRSPRIQRHHNHGPQNTSKESRNPLRRIRAPQHHAFARRNPSPLQLRRKPPRQRTSSPYVVR